LMSGIEGWLATPRSPKPTTVLRGDAMPLIAHMRELLNDYNGDAVDLLDELSNALCDCNAGNLIPVLRQSLSAYDFDAALAALDKIEAGCLSVKSKA